MNIRNQRVELMARQLAAETGQGITGAIEAFGIEIAVVDRRQANLARGAYQTFGGGNRPARLDLGDCFAYAPSKARGEPRLFKGEDFRQTDVEAAV